MKECPNVPSGSFPVWLGPSPPRSPLPAPVFLSTAGSRHPSQKLWTSGFYTGKKPESSWIQLPWNTLFPALCPRLPDDPPFLDFLRIALSSPEIILYSDYPRGGLAIDSRPPVWMPSLPHKFLVISFITGWPRFLLNGRGPVSSKLINQ